MKNTVICLLFLILTACGSIPSNRVPCPKSVILAEFSKTVDFKKGGSIRSEIDSITPQCERDENTILVDLKVRITSFRPLALSKDPVKVNPSYFIATIDKTGHILSRSNHVLEVAFEEKQTTNVSFQYLQERIPGNKDVTLYVGFNLDEAQVNFLRDEREGKSRHAKRP